MATRTVQNIVYDARSVLNEFNKDGQITANKNITTLETDAVRYVNMVNKELYKEHNRTSTHEISHKRVPNLLGELSNFDSIDYIGTDQVYPTDGQGVAGATAYYFEVDDDATIYVEELVGGSWNILDTITVTGVTAYSDYKGLITPASSDNPIQLRFSGSTFYRHINRCLYSYPFKSTNIPDYRPWVKETMPSDFAELIEIIDEYPTRQYKKDPNYKWEGYNELYINFYYEGNLRIIYNPYPGELTALTDTVTLNNPLAEQAMTYYVASRIAADVNTDFVGFFEQKGNELKFEAKKQQPNAEQDINNVYLGWSNG